MRKKGAHWTCLRKLERKATDRRRGWMEGGREGGRKGVDIDHSDLHARPHSSFLSFCYPSLSLSPSLSVCTQSQRKASFSPRLCVLLSRRSGHSPCRSKVGREGGREGGRIGFCGLLSNFWTPPVSRLTSLPSLPPSLPPLSPGQRKGSPRLLPLSRGPASHPQCRELRAGTFLLPSLPPSLPPSTPSFLPPPFRLS